jgi:GAF domain-containing protein
MEFGSSQHTRKDRAAVCAALATQGVCFGYFAMMRCGPQDDSQTGAHSLQVNPDIRKEKWTADEDRLLASLVAEHGNRWADIARQCAAPLTA